MKTLETDPRSVNMFKTGGTVLCVVEGFEMHSFLGHLVEYLGDNVVSSREGQEGWAARIDAYDTDDLPRHIELVTGLMTPKGQETRITKTVLEPGELDRVAEFVARNIGAHSIAA